MGALRTVFAVSAEKPTGRWQENPHEKGFKQNIFFERVSKTASLALDHGRNVFPRDLSPSTEKVNRGRVY